MLLIGIAGGIASGKSTVAQMFCKLGARLLDADRAGHEVLQQPEVVAEIRRRWGEKMLTADGTVDRRAVAQVVFTDPQALAALEQLTHPRIRELLEAQIAEFRREGAQVVLLDAALMFKAGWHRQCDKVVFVDAPRSVRLERAASRGWSPEDFAAREAAQTPLDVKRAAADFIIDNRGALEETRQQVKEVWDAVRGEGSP